MRLKMAHPPLTGKTDTGLAWRVTFDRQPARDLSTALSRRSAGARFGGVAAILSRASALFRSSN
jgi:hypothetical protein